MPKHYLYYKHHEARYNILPIYWYMNVSVWGGGNLSFPL